MRFTVLPKTKENVTVEPMSRLGPAPVRRRSHDGAQEAREEPSATTLSAQLAEVIAPGTPAETVSARVRHAKHAIREDGRALTPEAVTEYVADHDPRPRAPR